MELVCLDIETTGFDGSKDQVIEFAAVKFDGDTIIETFTELTDPGIPIPHIVSTITGIKNKDVKGKMDFEEYRSQLEYFIGDCPIVGHNINFDTGFLRHKGMSLDNKEIDTLELSTTLIPDQASYSLESLCQQFSISHEKKHRALDDVMANIKLLHIIMDRIKALKDIEISNICHYLSKSNWGSRDLFYEELQKRKLEPTPFLPPKLKVAKEKNDDYVDAPKTSAEEIFGKGGAIEKIYGKKYEARASQNQMANLVSKSFKNEHNLICEAGTGTGKSLAYLIPSALFAIENKKKVIISTYTNNLQDQLSEKDVPLTEKIIAAHFEGKKIRPLKSTLLKGRKHYLSIARLIQFLDRSFFEDPEIIAAIKIIIWANRTKTGDRKEIELRGKENHIWHEVCCQENGCPHDNHGSNYPCFLLKNRAEAKKSQIIITNHSLLLQDCLSDSPILPYSNHIVIDEAHNLEDVATKSFSEIFINFAFENLIEKCKKALNKINLKGKGDAQSLFGSKELSEAIKEAFDRLMKAESSTSIAFGLLGIFLQNYVDPFSKYQNDIVIDDVKTNSTSWHRAKDSFDSLPPHIEELISSLKKVIANLKKQEEFEELKVTSFDIQNLIEKLCRSLSSIERFFKIEDDNLIMWGNISRDGQPYLKSAPIKVGPHLKKNLFDIKDSVIMTSATLSVSHNFDYLKGQLGLTENVEEIILPSPFFYADQCKIVVVEDIPAPREHGHLSSIMDSLKQIIEEKGGRILVLLTSKATITGIYKTLFDHCKEIGINLYAQGVSGGRGKILQNFKHNPGKSIILGLNSFWEGVDLPGDMLNTVVIQKLPFDHPADPLHAARGNLSQNAFMDYSVPRAILRFKQGFGRLIRSAEDEGNLVILDSRIAKKQYGRTFLESLPDGIPIVHISQKELKHNV